LVIEGVQEEDFGEYSCEAENQYGRAKKTTVVSGEFPERKRESKERMKEQKGSEEE
jgi:hypothetical protein